MNEDTISPFGEYEVSVQVDSTGFTTAVMFAILESDGTTGDVIFDGTGSTIADALRDLARSIELSS